MVKLSEVITHLIINYKFQVTYIIFESLITLNEAMAVLWSVGVRGLWCLLWQKGAL